MDKYQLAEFMWKTRSDIHGNYPDSGPFKDQCQMVKDWVLTEAQAILDYLKINE